MSQLLQIRQRKGAPRRLVLVDLPWTRDKDPRVPLGHASLLAALAAWTKVDVRSVIAPVNRAACCASDAVTRVLSECAGAPPTEVDVAIGVYVWCEHVVRELIAGLRSRGFAGRIILGGPQISFAGPGVDRLYPGADVFVRGYGERALCELASHGARVPMTGVHYAGEPDRGERTEVALEELPSPWLDGSLSPAGADFVRWETQRGCPFRCSFCQHREPGARLTARRLARDRILEEAALLATSSVKEISVLDPIFNDTPRAAEILEEFARHDFRGRISLQCRAELVDERFLDAAERLWTRLEFGLQTIHEREGNAIRRKNQVSRVDATLKEVRRRGIDHEVTLIFGLPEQTLSSFCETVRWCIERRVPVIRAFPLMLLRGTELDNQRDQWGLVDDGTPMARVVASSTFSSAEWGQMAQVAEALARTEGRHPTTLEALLDIAAISEPALDRWQPQASV